MEKAVIYARYSTDKQTMQSIEGQVRECENFAKTKNLSIIGKYFDQAESGKSTVKRDRFNDMIKDSAKGLFQYVIVYQLDRFSRNRYDSAHYKHQLKKNGVKVLSAKENISDDPSGILMETVLEGMAEYYSAELAQKVKRGQYEAFLKGLSSGSGCYGYDTVAADASIPNCRAKKFVINKIESEVVKKIFDEYASGTKISQIEQWLAANNIKNRNGRIMPYNTIISMLKNPKYIGTLTFCGEHGENLLPAIVSKDVFQQVQKRIDLNKRNTSTFRPPERFLITSKTYCGYCKSSIVADTGRSSSNGEVYRYYKCFRKKKEKMPCEKTQVSKEWLENIVIAAVMELLNQNGMIENIARQIIEYNDELQENPKLKLYEKQMQECEKALNNIMRAVEQGIFNDKTQERMLQLESDKADLLWRIDGEKLDVPIKLDFDELIYWFEQFKSGDIKDQSFRERLADAFINKVILFNDKMIIVYNVKGHDKEKITVEQILDEYEQEKEKRAELEKFNSQQYGAPGQIRTDDRPLTRRLRYHCATEACVLA